MPLLGHKGLSLCCSELALSLGFTPSLSFKTVPFWELDSEVKVSEFLQQRGAPDIIIWPGCSGPGMTSVVHRRDGTCQPDREAEKGHGASSSPAAGPAATSSV